MRIPLKGLSGPYHPSFQTKEFPPDSSARGSFSAASISVTRRVAFASGTGDRNVSFFRTPTVPFILESAMLRLVPTWTQNGTADAIALHLELERVAGSG